MQQVVSTACFDHFAQKQRSVYASGQLTEQVISGIGVYRELHQLHYLLQMI